MNTKLPAKLPMVGQRTYVGMAHWYLEAALRELGPSARRKLYTDLRKLWIAWSRRIDPRQRKSIRSAPSGDTRR